MRATRGPLGVWTGCGLALLASACTVGDLAGNLAGNAVGGRAGEIARAATSSALDSVQQMQVKFSPEQEYYIGRAAAAELIMRYGLDPATERQAYVQRIGASLVALSTRIVATYGGYHFAVLDDEAPNGWSAPGGFVFITRGALLRAESEDEVAGILAHEIAHVSLRHAEKIIVRGRESGVLAGSLGRIVGAAGGDQGVIRNQAQLLGDVSSAMVASLTRQGYGSDAEYEADREGTLILYDAGYDGRALMTYLMDSPRRAAGTWDTHPLETNRVAALRPVVATYGGDFEATDAIERAARVERFRRVMGGGPIEGASDSSGSQASEMQAPESEDPGMPSPEDEAPEPDDATR